MKLGVWYQEDVRHNLDAAAEAAELIRTNTPAEQAYLLGYNAALNIVRASFGIAPEPPPIKQIQAQVEK